MLFAQEDTGWPNNGFQISNTGTNPGDDVFRAWYRSDSKLNSVKWRVWLGDVIGAKAQGSINDGRTWIDIVDTRGVSGNNDQEAYLGWGTYAARVYIDDIIVENDDFQADPNLSKLTPEAESWLVY